MDAAAINVETNSAFAFFATAIINALAYTEPTEQQEHSWFAGTGMMEESAQQVANEASYATVLGFTHVGDVADPVRKVKDVAVVVAALSRESGETIFCKRRHTVIADYCKLAHSSFTEFSSHE